MAKSNRPKQRRKGHETHLVVIQQCDCCARHVVLRARAVQLGAYDDKKSAVVAAELFRRQMVDRPDPAPLLVHVNPWSRAIAGRDPIGSMAGAKIAAHLPSNLA